MRTHYSRLIPFVVVFTPLVFFGSSDAQAQVNLPTKDEIHWRAFVESDPSFVLLRYVVTSRSEPFASLAYEEILRRTEGSDEERVEALTPMVGYIDVISSEQSEEVLKLVVAHRSTVSEQYLITAARYLQDQDERDAVVSEVLSRDPTNRRWPRSLRFVSLLELDISDENKERLAQQTVEAPLQYFPTSFIVLILCEVSEPWKERAFARFLEKSMNQITNTLQITSTDCVPEPYASVLATLKEVPQGAAAGTLIRLFPRR